jgi:hypothetical protein
VPLLLLLLAAHVPPPTVAPPLKRSKKRCTKCSISVLAQQSALSKQKETSVVRLVREAAALCSRHR